MKTIKRMKRIRFSRAELELIANMSAIASAALWGEGDYASWDEDSEERAVKHVERVFASLQRKVWELISRADGLPSHLEGRGDPARQSHRKP